MFPALVTAHPPDGHVRAGGEFGAGRVTGGNASVKRGHRHTERLEQADNLRIRNRGIGDQADLPTLLAKFDERVARLGEGGAAIVDHAPDIAKDGVIEGREAGEAGRKLGGGHGRAT